MHNIKTKAEIQLSLINLKSSYAINNRARLKYFIKELSNNKTTTSNKLNSKLNHIVQKFQSQPIEEIEEWEKNKYSLNNALKAITSPSNQELTYKGVNLGSAIHMKLAVTISQLLKNK